MGELREQRELRGQKGRGRAGTKRRKKNTLNTEREHAWRTKKTGITIKTLEKYYITGTYFCIFVTDMVHCP